MVSININVRNTYVYCGDGCCSFPAETYIDVEVDDVLVHEETTPYAIRDEEEAIQYFQGRDELEDLAKVAIIEIVY